MRLRSTAILLAVAALLSACAGQTNDWWHVDRATLMSAPGYINNAG
jgi:hypothetical protein